MPSNLKNSNTLNHLQLPRNVLLNPGPCTTTHSVKMAQIVPDICPREKEFGEVMHFVMQKLTDLAEGENLVSVLFCGSGTAGVEAVLSSICHNQKILVIHNGAYSKRMLSILKTYSANVFNFESSYIQPIDFNNLENILKQNHFNYICCVHNETGTGLLNDIQKISDLAHQYHAELVVDAMSSFAALPINMQNIHFLIASSNKNIQGMPGISFIICQKPSLEKLKNIPAKSFYLDLYAQYTYFNQTKQLRFTPPVQTIYALKQAIIELEKETIIQRYARYAKSWQTLINGLKDFNLKCLLPLECQSKIITAIYEPQNPLYSFDEMHDFLYQKGFTIYPGKINDYNTFRIANIGDITYKDIQNFLIVLKDYLIKIHYF